MLERTSRVGFGRVVITGGSCEAFKTDKGRKTSLRTIGPGDVFGETAIFTSKPRTASVRAITPLTCMVVTRESLEEELALDSWMGAFVKALAARFRELDGQHTGMRGELEDARQLARIIEAVAFDGEAGGEHKEMPWGPPARALAAETGKSESELASLVDTHGRLQLDRARGVLSLRRVV